jgi:hypothetical protein
MNSTSIFSSPIRLLFPLAAAAGLATLVWMLHFSGYGFDFTDEGFYLIWAAEPFRYSVSLSQFGFVYHPAYVLLDGDIALLRQANVLVTFGLASALAFSLLRTTPAGAASRAVSAMASLGYATASLVLFCLWLVTPSYNSLNAQALLITALGVVWAASPGSPLRHHAGLTLIGMGGWLAFMAKPSTAAALGVLVLLYWIASGRLRFKTVLLPTCVASALMLASAWTIDGSIGQFVERISRGLELGRALGGGHTLERLVRLDDFSLTTTERNLFAAGVLVPCVCAWLIRFASPLLRFLGVSGAAAMVGFIGLGIVLAFPDLRGLGAHRGLLLSGAAAGGLLYTVIAFISRRAVQLPRERICLALFLLALPYCHAFGTNGNYWWVAAFVGIFWVLSGMLVAASVAESDPSSGIVALLAITATALSVLLLQAGMNDPYRQPQPLRANEHAIDVGRPGSTLKLTEGYARYISEARNRAHAAGLASGTPVIDLSGQSPGLLYALGAQSPGQAWVIGGYPGSAPLAELALKTVTCEELSAAWVLAEPQGPRAISDTVLNSFGAHMARDYEQVGHWATAAGAGGYPEERQQTLWKPTREPTVAADACRAARAGVSP